MVDMLQEMNDCACDAVDSDANCGDAVDSDANCGDALRSLEVVILLNATPKL